MANELIKKETLEGPDFDALVERGEKLHQVKEAMVVKTEHLKEKEAKELKEEKKISTKPAIEPT